MTNKSKPVRRTAAVLLAFGLLLTGFAVPCLAQAPAGPVIPKLPELNWEKRSDWLDVKTGKGPYGHLMGSPTLPEGRVTLSSPKICGGSLQGSPTFETYFTVDNYRGRVSSVMAQYFNPTPTYDPNKKAFKIVTTGEAPLDVLLMANAYQQAAGSSPGVRPVVEGGSNVTRTLLGNTFVYLQHQRTEPVPNVLTPDGLRLAALALDDFRELGELDLELNHTARKCVAVNE